ncbi:MAG: hypothetical protein KGL39_44015, partial [Patescibacteria group bacterium]|nr:hypothetical protein [Patescibacteria group bacterium]
DLMAELCAIEYKPMGNKMYIEEKLAMKKRLNGKSPDHADSLMLTLSKGEHVVWDSIDEPEQAGDDADYEPPAHDEDEAPAWSSGGSSWDGSY